MEEDLTIRNSFSKNKKKKIKETQESASIHNSATAVERVGLGRGWVPALGFLRVRFHWVGRKALLCSGPAALAVAFATVVLVAGDE